MSNNPFAPSTSSPGVGTIHVSRLPAVLRTVSYQYPLKLIAPASLPSPASSTPIHTVFLLTYGGGLVAGDTIDLTITLEPSTRLVVLTQGSTKIFKTPSRDVVSGQATTVRLQPGSALCYLPDPVQPFDESAFEQRQVYELMSSKKGEEASLCVCDWVSEGRTARGEKWGFHKYGSKNEVYAVNGEKKRLLLRDNMILDASSKFGGANGLSGRMDHLGVFGTLILRGPVFQALGDFFMDEFGKLPRIGNRQWDKAEEVVEDIEKRRKERQKMETRDGLLWTAANVRGSVMVKFGAREVEGARNWLRWMLKEEGSVEREFGERALLCLK